ncbi:hypothetical protein Tco_1252765 [Tanacetum coccineum]
MVAPVNQIPLVDTGNTNEEPNALDDENHSASNSPRGSVSESVHNFVNVEEIKDKEIPPHIESFVKTSRRVSLLVVLLCMFPDGSSLRGVVELGSVFLTIVSPLTIFLVGGSHSCNGPFPDDSRKTYPCFHPSRGLSWALEVLVATEF